MIRSTRRPTGRRLAARLLALGATVALVLPAAPATTFAAAATPADGALRSSEPSPAAAPADAPGSRPGPDSERPRQAGCDDAPSSAGLPAAELTLDLAGGRPIVAIHDDGAAASACSYIVRLVAGASARDVTKGLPATSLGRQFRSALHGFAARLDARQLAALRRNPKVESVTPDWIGTIADSEPAASWGLDRIDQRNLPLSGMFDLDPTGGAGVTAYVVDTGINPSHTEFAGRIGAGAGFATDNSGTADCNGHGTHVAGTLAGSVHGIARAATIVPVRVLDCGGTAPYSSIVAGLDWVIADHDPGEPAVLNMSIGGPLDPGLNSAIQATIDDGVVVIVAAGNANADACGFTPSSAPNAITVGATDSTDARAAFSNFGGCLDLWAPGVGIASAWIGSASATNTISGTSMASPHVAGIAAVIVGRNPTASPAAIAAAMVGDATTGLVVDGGGSPNRLAHLGLPVPGPQTVSFPLGSLYLSEPPITLSGLSTSGQVPSFQSLTTATCHVSGTTLTPVAKGTCTVRASVPGGGGWNAAHADRSVPVYIARQTITFAAPWAELSYGATNAPAATASSGLAVAYQSLGSPCSMEGSLVRGVEVGDCLLVARQAGNATYGPAEPVYFTRSVVPAIQTLTGPSGVRIPVGGSVAWAGHSSAGLPVNVLTATPATCSATSGHVAGLALGTCRLRLTQPGSPGVRAAGTTSLKAISSPTPWYTKVAVRSDGRPVIATAEGEHLHLLSCADPACSSSDDRIVVDLAERYPGAQMAFVDLSVVVAGDRPVLGYVEVAPRPKANAPDDVDWIARVLACDDADCTTWTDRIIEDPDPLADLQVEAISATVSSAGAPIFAYSGHNFGARLYFCADADCATGTPRDLASPQPGVNDYGLNPAITLDAAGRPVIAYLRDADPQWSTVILARCGDPACSTIAKTVIGEASRWWKPAVVVPADDRPVAFWTNDVTVHDPVHYLDYRVMRARCTDPGCAVASAGIVDATGVLEWDGFQNTWSVAGFDLSAALGPDGFPRVSYLAWVRRVPSSWQTWGATPLTAIVATCADANCGTVRRSFLDEWSRTTSLPFRSPQVPIVTAPNGSLVAAFGFFPEAYTSESPQAVGVKLATCADAVCGTGATAQVVLETSPPMVSAPVVTLRTGAALSGASLPVQVTWTAADAGSGVEHHELARSTNGGATWSIVASSLTSPSLASFVATSGTTRFRVRAVDHEGNVSAWVAGPTLTPRLVQQTSSAIRWSSGWTTVTNPVYTAGSARTASTAGRAASFTFSGRSVGLLATVGPGRGKVRVYVNGTLVTTLDLGGPTLRYRVLAWQRTWTTTATRTVRLVVVGTVGRPRIDVDGFGTIRAG